MKLSEIKESWDQDAKVDPDKLDEEANKCSSLHAKYYAWYVDERRILKMLQQELDTLRKDKWQFYTEGPSQEQIEDGWELPPRGRIMKPDMPRYMAADKHVQDKEMRVVHQECKVDFLLSIIEAIKNRGFNLKHAIDFIRFQSGF